MVADQDGYSLIILGESYIKINITYSSGKWSDPVNFLNSIYVKKGYMEMAKKIYLETLKVHWVTPFTTTNSNCLDMLPNKIVKFYED